MMKTKPLVIALIFMLSSAYAAEIPCKKEAEAYALAETKKKGNLPDPLFTAHPSEKEGDAVVVYIGARAAYNYFKLQYDKKCKLTQVIDTEFVPAKK